MRNAGKVVGIATFCLLFTTVLGGFALHAFAQDQNSDTTEAVPEAGPEVRIEQLENVPFRNDFSIGPTRFSLEVQPGEETVAELQITSQIEMKTTFEVGVEDFTSQDDPEKYTKFLGEEKGQFSAKEWFTPAVQTFTLEHGERIYLPVTIDVPMNAEVGDHYSVVFIKTVLGEDQEETGITFSSRIGSLFLLSVGDGLTYNSGEFTSLETDKNVYSSLPVNFVLHFQNEGNVHLIPFGKIVINNMLGSTVAEVSVPDWVVLRESSREQTVEWDTKQAFGRYTATAQIERGYDNIIDVRTVSFWVIPVKTVGIALGTLVAVIVVYKVLSAKFEIRRKTSPISPKESLPAQ